MSRNISDLVQNYDSCDTDNFKNTGNSAAGNFAFGNSTAVSNIICADKICNKS